MSRQKKAKPYASTPYTQVPDGLWISPEFNELNPRSRCLFMVMLAKWKPYEPDQPFALTYDEAQKITGFGRRTIFNAIQELMKEGFIGIPQRGRYPHNISLYTLEHKWLSRKYPKQGSPLPKYVVIGN